MNCWTILRLIEMLCQWHRRMEKSEEAVLVLEAANLQMFFLVKRTEMRWIVLPIPLVLVGVFARETDSLRLENGPLLLRRIRPGQRDHIKDTSGFPVSWFP